MKAKKGRFLSHRNGAPGTEHIEGGVWKHPEEFDVVLDASLAETAFEKGEEAFGLGRGVSRRKRALGLGIADG